MSIRQHIVSAMILALLICLVVGCSDVIINESGIGNMDEKEERDNGIEHDEVGECGGYSVQYYCPLEVKDAKSAADCFNAYFEKELMNIMEEKGEIPDNLAYIYQKVSESDIVIINGDYHIVREDGFGSPYFIREGVIMYDHS